jgi:hypothetical protein
MSNMSTDASAATSKQTRLSNRLRAGITQESIATAAVSLIVGVAVILPLFMLFVGSFLMLDDSGFDTAWGSIITR